MYSLVTDIREVTKKWGGMKDFFVKGGSDYQIDYVSRNQLQQV